MQTSDINIVNDELGDGSVSCVKKCESNRGCLTCPVFSPSNFVSSTITHRKHKVINPNNPIFCHCGSSNLIYLITCNKCKFQYVGQTCQMLRSRISKHRNDIRRGVGGCPFLVKHFNSDTCRGRVSLLTLLKKWRGLGGRLEEPLMLQNPVFVETEKISG